MNNEKDYTEYNYIESDCTGWLENPINNLIQIFSSRDEMARAFRQCKQFNEKYKQLINDATNIIMSKYNELSDEKIAELINQFVINSNKDKQAELELAQDLIDDTSNLIFIYQEYMTVTKSDIKLYNDNKQGVMPEMAGKITKLCYTVYELNGKLDGNIYEYISHEFGISWDGIKQQLSNEEIEEFEKAIKSSNNEDEILKYAKVSFFETISGIRLARKLYSKQK